MVMVFARGLSVLTRMYFPDEDVANADDHVLFAVVDSASSIARSIEGGLEFDVRLQGEVELPFSRSAVFDRILRTSSGMPSRTAAWLQAMLGVEQALAAAQSRRA